MKTFRNKAMALAVSLAMIMTSFAAFTVVSFADEQAPTAAAAITVKAEATDGTQTVLKEFTQEQVNALAANNDYYPYYWAGKGGKVVAVAKGVLVKDLVEGLNMNDYSALKPEASDGFKPNNSQLDYLYGGVTYIGYTGEGDITETTTSVEVPFAIATEMYTSTDNDMSIDGTTYKTVGEVAEAIKAKIAAKEAKASANRSVVGSLSTTDTAGNKFCTGANAIILYEKADSTLTAKAAKKTFNAKAKKKTTIAKAIKVSGNAGAVTYVKKTGDKKITVAKNGKITVKKGLKKGKTYSVKINVKDAGSDTVKGATKTVTVKIKVK